MHSDLFNLSSKNLSEKYTSGKVDYVESYYGDNEERSFSYLIRFLRLRSLDSYVKSDDETLTVTLKKGFRDMFFTDMMSRVEDVVKNSDKGDYINKEIAYKISEIINGGGYRVVTDDGEMSIEDFIRKYVPEKADYKFTIRQCFDYHC